jgi:hypothetical protein
MTETIRWIVYEGAGVNMVPLNDGGVLRVFTSYKAAAYDRPMLGVVAAVGLVRLDVVCKRYNLTMQKGRVVR